MPDSMHNNRDRTAIIVAAAAFFICITMGVRQSFGLFLPLYTAELVIGRDTFSLAIAVQNILWGLASPVFGALADRRGAVSALLIGALLYTGGMLVMAAAGGGGTLFLAQAMVGLGLAGAGFSVVLGTVGKVVTPKNRSLVLGIVTAAGSVGQFVLVPVAQWGIDAFAMRGGVLFLAGIAFLMALVAPLMRLPKGAPMAAAHSSVAVLRTAFRSRSYVLLFLGFFVCGFQVVFIATHLPAYVADAGLSTSAAVSALALIGLFNIFGSIFCGWVGGVMPKKNALAIFYLLRSLVIVLFLLFPLTPLSVVVFGAAIGFLWLGTVPLTSGLVAVMFGPRHMSMLYGGVFVFHQVGSSLGALAGGALYEITGTYDAAWFISIALGVVAAFLHYPIKEQSNVAFVRQFG